MKYALLLLLLMAGCAEKKHVISSTPGTHIYKDCKEVSINVKTDELTVVCPLHPKDKKWTK